MIIVDFIGWVVTWIVTLGAYRVVFSVEIDGVRHKITLLPRLW